MYATYHRRENARNIILKILFLAGMGALCLAFIVGYFALFYEKQQTITVNRTFYFLAERVEEQTASVAAHSAYIGGGAGYAFTRGGVNYVAFSAYPTEREAVIVQDRLKKREKETEIVPLTVTTFYFKGREQISAKAGVEACVTALLNNADLLYGLANGLDETRYTQEAARELLKGVKASLQSAQAVGNGYTEREIGAGVKKCTEILNGIIYAKDVRYLQLQLWESVYNLQSVFSAQIF